MAEFTVGESADRDQLLVDRDLRTLEYLVYQAVQIVLDEHRARVEAEVIQLQDTERADDAIALVDTFLPIFRKKHPGVSAPPVIKFRLQLLTFTVLFCRRLFESISSPGRRRLKALRHENRSRTRTFFCALPPDSTHPCLNWELLTPLPFSRPLSTEACVMNRQRLLETCNVAASSAPISRKEDVHLMDTLPMFMKLNATVLNENPAWSLNAAWFELAAEYMLQAASEQYALGGATGLQALQQCFAWGPNEALKSTDDEELKANIIFSVGGEETERLWGVTQTFFLREMIPHDAEHLQHRFNLLMRRYPIMTFESKIARILTGFLAIHDPPTMIRAELEQAIGSLTRGDPPVELPVQ